MVCAGCLKSITLLIARRVGDFYYCPKCYEIIMNKIKKSYKQDDESEE
jgi:hypothetical protein